MSETTTHADFEKINRANSCKSSFSFLDLKLSDRKLRKRLQRHRKTSQIDAMVGLLMRDVRAALTKTSLQNKTLQSV